MAGPIRISVLADGSQARRELGSIAGQTQSLGSKMAGFGKKAGVAIAAGLAVAGVAAVKFGADAVSAASDAQQSLGATETVFGKFADTVVKTSEQAASKYGLSANVYRENANLLGSLFKNQGVELDKLGGKTEGMIATAADLAATFGGTTTTAVEALGAAFKGEYDQLEKYGISIKQSDVNARLAAKGQDKLTGSALKTAEQIAKSELIAKQAAQSNGAFAKETDTLAHQQQVLAAQFENVKAKIGSVLLPIITTITSFISTKALPAFQRWSGELRDRLAPIVENIRDGFSKLQEKLAPVGAWFSEHPELIRGVGIALGVAAATALLFAAAMGVVALVTSPITLTVVAIAALGAAIAYAYKNSETFREGVTAVGDALKTGLGAALDWVTAKWREFAPMIAESLQVVTAAVKGFVGFMLPFWRNSFEMIWNIVKAAFNTIKGVIEGQLKIIQGVINIVMGLIKGDWGRAWEGIKQILSGVWKIIESIVSGAINAVKAVLAGTLANIRDLWSVAWDGIKNVASRTWEGIKDLVSTGIDKVVGFVKALPGRINSIAAGAFDGIKDAFRSAINFIIDGWNNLSFSIPGFDPPGPGPKFPGITIGTPNIPRLASGGVTTGATLALIGDNPGGREAIIPLDRYDLSGAGSLVPLLERLNTLVEAQIAADRQSEQIDGLRALTDEIRGLRDQSKDAPNQTSRAILTALRTGGLRTG